jgi:hypothetical protein
VDSLAYEWLNYENSSGGVIGVNSNPSRATTLEGSKLMSHWVFLCQRVAVGVPQAVVWLACGYLAALRRTFIFLCFRAAVEMKPCVTGTECLLN